MVKKKESFYYSDLEIILNISKNLLDFFLNKPLFEKTGKDEIRNFLKGSSDKDIMSLNKTILIKLKKLSSDLLK